MTAVWEWLGKGFLYGALVVGALFAVTIGVSIIKCLRIIFLTLVGRIEVEEDDDDGQEG